MSVEGRLGMKEQVKEEGGVDLALYCRSIQVTLLTARQWLQCRVVGYSAGKTLATPHYYCPSNTAPVTVHERVCDSTVRRRGATKRA